MKFQLDEVCSDFEWPVVIKQPYKGGFKEGVGFTATFAVLDQDEIDKERAAAGTVDSDIAFCKKILKGWDGVDDKNGKPMAFNKTNLNKVLKVPFIRTAIVTDYYRAMNGLARAKN
ncbi:hypothetical protein NO559_07775 [Dasania sp. GY-MA-18]|uniref:Uncharacterized protein n=1 Tax=Dasania phycosphaerae TaxID=2950436 RepID=A0A9J6RLN2_9GAMM|nr:MULTISPECIES: phage tail assembly chaperone [Dasania]MCR8922665.1 hypothetical protein [Dasania sp. GY-MA-18]MCZ0865095.1 hypothetical protein [Dasania phycosphaerae]MCZ0868821.1 hypothetical protein [Dasania phycosphaerae]